MKSREKDWLAALVFLLAGITAITSPNYLLPTQILSLAFIISGVYGMVCISKNKKFIF